MTFFWNNLRLFNFWSGGGKFRENELPSGIPNVFMGRWCARKKLVKQQLQQQQRVHKTSRSLITNNKAPRSVRNTRSLNLFLQNLIYFVFFLLFKVFVEAPEFWLFWFLHKSLYIFFSKNGDEILLHSGQSSSQSRLFYHQAFGYTGGNDGDEYGKRRNQKWKILESKFYNKMKILIK